MSVVIIDCGLGNLHSVVRGCRKAGHEPIVADNPAGVERADRLILPGVGAFGNAMTAITRRGLREPILEFVESGRPFLGICLGMQLLFESSEEFGKPEGLGILNGSVKRLICDDPVPHVGWNRIHFTEHDSKSLFAGIDEGSWMYFVHSFFVDDADRKYTTSVVNYGGIELSASICHENIHATQFHPEKSGLKGLETLSNFLNHD